MITKLAPTPSKQSYTYTQTHYTANLCYQYPHVFMYYKSIPHTNVPISAINTLSPTTTTGNLLNANPPTLYHPTKILSDPPQADPAPQTLEDSPLFLYVSSPTQYPTICPPT
jgi:hypothetical protein